MIYVLGGSNPLNFRVLDGTTQPANLEENDVWVNTSTKITSWDFSATEPRRVSNNKNLIVYPFYSETGTSNGITWTDNKDGTVNANGTASKTSYFRPSYSGVDRYEFILKPGTYHLSGCQIGGSQETFYLQVGYSSNNWEKNTWVNDYGSGSTFTVTEESMARVACVVVNGTNVSNITFKPQLEKGSTATSFVKGDATGQVWFSVGTSSTAPFNALKKDNVLAVYPLSAKQYVNGVWVDKTAKTYQNGAWVDWIPAGTLYDKGNQCTHVTGGWYTAASGAGSVTYNATSITVKVTNNNDAYVICSTKNKIDLTNYNTIKVNVTGWSKSANSVPGFCISDSVGTTVHRIANIDITGTGVWSLDVSSFSGEYYVCFWGYWATNWTLTFDKVWME